MKILIFVLLIVFDFERSMRMKVCILNVIRLGIKKRSIKILNEKSSKVVSPLIPTNVLRYNPLKQIIKRLFMS